MNKTRKNGFTLIELLAVIVVLAILALIAVPIVLNIIKDARNNSNKRSIESYARAIDYAVSEYMSENPDQEIVTWDDVKDKVEYKGKVECQWGENLSSISTTGEITLHGCKVNNKTNTIYGYVNGKVTEEKEIVYKEYNVGDEITYKGMKFYVIAPSDTTKDYVTLLKDEPLTVDEVNKYGAGHVNKYTKDSRGTAYNENGYGGIAYYTSENCGYVNNSWVETGCTTNYSQSEVKYVVDAWTNDKLNASDLKLDSLGYKSRLMTKEEYLNNGTNETITTISENILKFTPFDYISRYHYWTMSVYEDSNNYIYEVHYIDFWNYIVHAYRGGYIGEKVRPVINLKKSAIQ